MGLMGKTAVFVAAAPVGSIGDMPAKSQHG
jgi:hypothetical protein